MPRRSVPLDNGADTLPWVCPRAALQLKQRQRLHMSGLITGSVLVVLGVLAAASSIVARRPNAQVYIDKLLPYQGWFGFIACLWGIWIIVSAILNLNWFRYVPVWW